MTTPFPALGMQLDGLDLHLKELQNLMSASSSHGSHVESMYALMFQPGGTQHT